NGGYSVSCNNVIHDVYKDYNYVDGNGTVHPIPGLIWDKYGCAVHHLTGTATDGSGYVMVLNDTTGAWTVYDRGGGIHTSGILTDPNGNSMTGAIDALGQTALTNTSVNGDQTAHSYTYTDAGATTRQVSTSSPQVQIQGPCSSTSSYANLVTSIAYPDNTSLQVTYEPIAIGSAIITGR